MSKILLADGVEWQPGMIVWNYFGRKLDTTGFSVGEREMFNENSEIAKCNRFVNPDGDDHNDVSFYYSTPDGGKKQAIKSMRETLDVYQEKIKSFQQSKDKDWFRDINYFGLESLLDQSV